MQYYVYELIDPRDGSVFYVGKGKGKRCHQHMKEAAKGAVGRKADVIREIWNDGLEVTVKVIKRFGSEDAAFAFEKRRIAHHGLHTLTNIASGGREMSAHEFAQRRDARRLAKSSCRMIRVLQKHAEVGFWFCGKWYAIARDTAERIRDNSIQKVFEILGESEALAEYRKRNVFIEIKG